MALAYAREGADVAFTYLPEDEQEAEQTVKLIEDAGSRALALPGDLQDEEFCQEAVAQTVAEFGGLNVLVNNAGYQLFTSHGLEDLGNEQFDRTFKTNVYALFWLCKAALPHLQPGAAIINTSSYQAYQPGRWLIDFAASKAAVNSMTFSLAEALGPRGIRVNAVAPGDIGTTAQPSAPPAQNPAHEERGSPLWAFRWAGPDSPPNSRLPMCCWPPRIPATFRARSSVSRAESIWRRRPGYPSRRQGFSTTLMQPSCFFWNFS